MGKIVYRGKYWLGPVTVGEAGGGREGGEFRKASIRWLGQPAGQVLEGSPVVCRTY